MGKDNSAFFCVYNCALCGGLSFLSTFFRVLMLYMNTLNECLVDETEVTTHQCAQNLDCIPSLTKNDLFQFQGVGISASEEVNFNIGYGIGQNYVCITVLQAGEERIKINFIDYAISIDDKTSTILMLDMARTSSQLPKLKKDLD